MVMSNFLNTRIDVGDTVVVRFEHLDWIRGKVEYVPNQVGDCWIIVGNNGGVIGDSRQTVHYVQQFSSITKELEGSSDDDIPF